MSDLKIALSILFVEILSTSPQTARSKKVKNCVCGPCRTENLVSSSCQLLHAHVHRFSTRPDEEVGFINCMNSCELLQDYQPWL